MGRKWPTVEAEGQGFSRALMGRDPLRGYIVTFIGLFNPQA